MSYRKKIEAKIRKEKEEISRIKSEITEREIQLREAKSRVDAFEEALKLSPQEEGVEVQKHPLKGIREGSLAYYARNALRNYGQPLQILELLKIMELPKEKRQTVGGILSNYVRSGEVFTRPKPGVFGLKEFEKNENGEGEQKLKVL